MEDFEFEIFADDDNAQLGGVDEIMNVIKQRVEAGEMTFAQAIDIFVDILRPGGSRTSHDVRPIFTGALHAYGYGHLADKFASVHVNSMPWGIGFVISVEKDLNFKLLSKGEQEAIINSLCVTLKAGHLNAKVVNNRIVITDDDGDESLVDIDDIVSQFRVQLEEDLGPEGQRRWIL